MRAERPLLAVAVCLLVFAAAPARGVPPQFSLQGRLTDAQGVNRDGSFAITVRLWASAAGGPLLYKETKAAVPVVNGGFSFIVGGAPDADSPRASIAQVFTGDVAYLEFQAAGETAMAPRQPLLSVPYAVKAELAQALAAPALFTVNVASVAVPLTVYSDSRVLCYPGTLLRFNAAAGQRAQVAFHGSIANTIINGETSVGIMVDDGPKGSFCHSTSAINNGGVPCAIDFLTAPLAAGEHTACLVVRTFSGTTYFVVDGTAEGGDRRAIFEARVLGGQP